MRFCLSQLVSVHLDTGQLTCYWLSLADTVDSLSSVRQGELSYPLGWCFGDRVVFLDRTLIAWLSTSALQTGSQKITRDAVTMFLCFHVSATRGHGDGSKRVEGWLGKKKRLTAHEPRASIPSGAPDMYPKSQRSRFVGIAPQA